MRLARYAVVSAAIPDCGVAGLANEKGWLCPTAEHILFLCVGILVGGTIYVYSGDVDLLSAIGAGLGAGALTYIGARLKLGWLRD